jgi:hypothetical protein
MNTSFSGRAVVALALGGLLLGSCGGNGASTSTPSSTLGTDSAATKVGGMADTTGTGTPASTGTSSTEGTMSSPASTTGTPTTGGTGASGTTNGTGAN